MLFMFGEVFVLQGKWLSKPFSGKSRLELQWECGVIDGCFFPPSSLYHHCSLITTVKLWCMIWLLRRLTGMCRCWLHFFPLKRWSISTVFPLIDGAMSTDWYGIMIKWSIHVKSAYRIPRLCIRPISQTSSSSALSNLFSVLWDMLWKAQVPPKVQMMAWRVFSTIIPMGVNLCHKPIPIDHLCIMCGATPESATHIILDCHFARCVWMFSPLGLRPCGVQHGTIKNLA